MGRGAVTGHRNAKGHHRGNRQVPKALNPKRIKEARDREKHERNVKRSGNRNGVVPPSGDWATDDFLLTACEKCLDTGIMVVAGIDTDCPECT